MTRITRRQAVAALLAFPTFVNGQEQWFPIAGDDGKPISNMRLPVELTSEVDELEGIVWAGSSAPDVTVVEFFDYNCPSCRKAGKELHALLGAEADLRLGLVNNAILSPMSAQAAKVELAFLMMTGRASAYEFHRSLFERRGVIDGVKALDVAANLGAPRVEVERLADSAQVGAMLARQMRLAASMGMSATPSFVIAGAGVFGYPGANALAGMVRSVRRCDQVVC